MSVVIEEERGGQGGGWGCGLDQLPLCSFESHDVSLSWVGQILRQSRERGGNLAPYDLIRRRFLISPSELSFSQRQSRIPRARFTPITISSHGGTIGRLGELTLMLKKTHKVKFSCHGTFNTLIDIGVPFMQIDDTVVHIEYRCLDLH